MKGYENDGRVNYDDLSGGGIGKVEGYGPVIGEYWRQYTDEQGRLVTACGERAKTVFRFCLKIECHNWHGIGDIRIANSTSEALTYASMLENNNWPNSSTISDEVLYKCADLVREAVRYYHEGEGNAVNGYVMVQGKFWGGYKLSYSY